MRKIIVGVPSYDGRLDVWFTHALIEAIRLSGKYEVDLQPIFLSYDALIQRSRNDLFKLAVESECDGLFFIDSDIEFHPEWIYKLINSEKDIIAAPCPKKSPFVEAYNVRAFSTGVDVDKDGLMKASGVGTGFMFISRAALVQLWEEAEPYTNEGKESRMVFNVAIENKELIGEDIFLCNRWRELGGDIWVDTSITCNHIGSMKFSGNFYGYLKKLEEQQASKQPVKKTTRKKRVKK